MQNRRAFLITTGAAALRPAFAAADLSVLTLREASDRIRDKVLSPVELTEACLKRIQRLNPALNAFITVTGEQALKTAREMEAELKAGKRRGPLHGVPIALKDNIDTAGIRTTAASELFKDRVPTEDAEVVRRLRDAGAVILGKLNMQEFAYGGTSDISYFGAVHNPWALDHIAGGSSGGSAAATAADLCLGALGTDTGGSVRIPSSYCGVVGFKPTYGRVSIRGIIPLAKSLDHCGPIAKSVEDAALMLQVIAGYDAKDPTTADVPVPDYSRAFHMDTSKLRLGLLRAPFVDNLDLEVGRAFDAAIGVMLKFTQGLTDAALPAMPSLLPILGWEAHEYHAKWIAESPGKYQPFTLDRIKTFAQGVNAQDYAAALGQMNQLRKDITKLFSTVDVLITATMPHAPETIAQSKNFDPDGIRNTSPFNLLGLPTISVPCGFTGLGLPIGMQITGAPWAELTVLALARAYERETTWNERHLRLA